MAENIILKARISKMQMAEPITEAAQMQTIVWEDLPLTLRDDAVEITEDEPQEEEVFSHENDAAEDYDVAGGGLKVKGSFIKLTYDNLVKLIGGVKTDANFQRSSTKLMLNKSLKFILRGGGEIVIPNAKGYVLTNLSVGHGGKSKFPFSFRCKKASDAWDCDIVW